MDTDLQGLLLAYFFFSSLCRNNGLTESGWKQPNKGDWDLRPIKEKKNIQKEDPATVHAVLIILYYNNRLPSERDPVRKLSQRSSRASNPRATHR